MLLAPPTGLALPPPGAVLLRPPDPDLGGPFEEPPSRDEPPAVATTIPRVGAWGQGNNITLVSLQWVQPTVLRISLAQEEGMGVK